VVVGLIQVSVETEKVRVVGIDQIRQCSRMKRMENGADVESARVKFAGPGFSSMSPERRKKARRSGPKATHYYYYYCCCCCCCCHRHGHYHYYNRLTAFSPGQPG